MQECGREWAKEHYATNVLLLPFQREDGGDRTGGKEIKFTQEPRPER